MHQIGDRIRISDEKAAYNGTMGTVLEVREGDSFPYRVKCDDNGFAFWFTAEEIVSSQPASQEPRIVTDFDKGFGIGGLGRHEEDPIIPTEAALERVEQMEARARTCRKCGQTDVFDGAMFTTDADSGLCDDCYG